MRRLRLHFLCRRPCRRHRPKLNPDNPTKPFSDGRVTAWHTVSGTCNSEHLNQQRFDGTFFHGTNSPDIAWLCCSETDWAAYGRNVYISGKWSPFTCICTCIQHAHIKRDWSWLLHLLTEKRAPLSYLCHWKIKFQANWSIQFLFGPPLEKRCCVPVQFLIWSNVICKDGPEYRYIGTLWIMFSKSFGFVCLL